MIVLENGNVSMTHDEVDALKSKYFVSMHSPSYTNIIGTYLPNGNSVGFHCWIDNMEFYVEEERVRIESDEHLASCFAMMDAIIKFNSFRPD
jgi:hypothetical protein